MRAIGLVLLSIAIMALLLTDADAKRRSSAQRRRGPAEAGARPIPSKASTTTAAIPRSINAGRRCWAAAAFADLIRFQGRRMGPATPGVQVRCARAAAGLPPAAYGTKRRLGNVPALLRLRPPAEFRKRGQS